MNISTCVSFVLPSLHMFLKLILPDLYVLFYLNHIIFHNGIRLLTLPAMYSPSTLSELAVCGFLRWPFHQWDSITVVWSFLIMAPESLEKPLAIHSLLWEIRFVYVFCQHFNFFFLVYYMSKFLYFRFNFNSCFTVIIFSILRAAFSLVQFPFAILKYFYLISLLTFVYFHYSRYAIMILPWFLVTQYFAYFLSLKSFSSVLHLGLWFN